MMLRKLPVAMIAALALAAAAHAQESPAPAGPPAQPPAAAAAAPRAPSYSESQMQDFARATVELQALGSQDPGAMTRAIEGAGMSVEEYNGMGDAMRANPALAASLTPYLDSANVERTARITREATQGLDRRWSPPPRHAAPVRKAAAHRKAHGKARAHKGKAATSHRHAAKHSSRAATSKHATHHRRHKG
jgi:glucose/arabinose dehydrogenase